ncbi:hypothetical protein LINPERPRIM_LOCUS28814 [Linum perenne]
MMTCTVVLSRRHPRVRRRGFRRS